MAITLYNRFVAAWQAFTKATPGWQHFFDRAGWTGNGTDTLTNPYQNSAWVMRAIKKCAGPIASVPLKFEAGEQELEDDVLEAFWHKPCQRLYFGDFIEANVGWLKLAGECFWLLDDTFLLPFRNTKAPTQFVLARPDRMQHITEKDKGLTGWRFTDGDGRVHALLPEQVIQIKFWNPYDDIRGLGEWEAAKMAAEADYSAGAFNKNLMQQNGDTGPYVVAKQGVIVGSEQYKAILAQLREKRSAALKGEFRPAFLTGDFTIEDPQVHVPDTAFNDTRLANRHEIFIALGVPASMADVVASYSVGSASDRYMLIEETCKPLAEKIAQAISDLSSRMTGKALEAYFDWDEHSTMQQVRGERITSAIQLWDRGAPWKELSEYFDLGLPEFDGWDTGYLPFNLAPASQAGESAYAEPTAPHAPEPADELKALFEQRAAEAWSAEKWQKARPEKERKSVEFYMSQRRDTIKGFEVRFNREVTKIRSEVLHKIYSNQSLAKGLMNRATATELLFDAEKFGKDLVDAFTPNWHNALNSAARQVWTEIGRKDNPMLYAPEEVLKFINNERANLIKDCADNVWTKIKNTLTDGLDKGDTMNELADRVRDAFNNDISKGRARTIAMTETAVAYGKGRHDGMVEAGVTKKEWLASGNPNMRQAHAEASGQIVGIDEPFDVGGEKLMHPGDPAGSPENVINCHCVEVPIVEQQEKGESGE